MTFREQALFFLNSPPSLIIQPHASSAVPLSLPPPSPPIAFKQGSFHAYTSPCATVKSLCHWQHTSPVPEVSIKNLGRRGWRRRGWHRFHPYCHYLTSLSEASLHCNCIWKVAAKEHSGSFPQPFSHLSACPFGWKAIIRRASAHIWKATKISLAFRALSIGYLQGASIISWTALEKAVFFFISPYFCSCGIPSTDTTTPDVFGWFSS